MIAARVIGTGTASLTIQLDRGERDGIRKDMGVITPDGVVGKVVESYPNASQVLLLTDKDSGVGAMLADSRTQSPVGGQGEPLAGHEIRTERRHGQSRGTRHHQRHGPASSRAISRWVRSRKSSPAIPSSRFASNRLQISSAWRKCWFFCRSVLSR